MKGDAKMYSEDGDFGLSRFYGIFSTSHNLGLYQVGAIGWHKCNDKYVIDRPNGTNLHTILFTVKGKGAMRIEKEEYTLTPGTVAFIPRNISSGYFTPKGGMWEFYWIHPNFGTTEQFLDTLALKNVYLTKFEAEYNCQQKIESIMKLCANKPSNYELLISQELSQLLHHLALCMSTDSEPASLSERAITYIQMYFSTDITIDEIAKGLFVSTAHLIRAFKKEIGMTPHQYLMQYRLHFAVQLLELSTYRVEEIAEKSGFYSASHFISCFKNEYGITPLQYREKALINEG